MKRIRKFKEAFVSNPSEDLFDPEFSDEEKMNRMMRDVDKYTSLLNILMNDIKGKWYEKIGQHILDSFSGKLLVQLGFITRSSGKDIYNDNNLRFLGISFMTGSLGDAGLSPESMQKLWGNPIFHDNFGEGGIEGLYEEDTSGYASYFKTIGGLNFHIGYDHRGTGVEVMCPDRVNRGGSITPESVFNSLKLLIDDVIYLYND